MKIWKIKADIREIVINRFVGLTDKVLNNSEVDVVNEVVNQITNDLYNTINKQVNQYMIDYFQEIINNLSTEK